ncbi:hypothetical protein PUNSTDRAFT_49537 [Punctularia strigosozonata HHB-11173 SS5]|uniref:uncharacterized protein n=1 Tax=Punctularia strigosozonata (strain HHB-11173) TaxID=741275 RepID=UPI0004416F08|nr:uncharacterized protein PUNSTDRAFT_49537 [Punctularia strigosozonata HHB-11173 SS5]EIN12238.1 hypothetical protein PUNSTDRAFT_49537 [Punctularia strigosozonata HHB-11173 SS5]
MSSIVRLPSTPLDNCLSGSRVGTKVTVFRPIVSISELDVITGLRAFGRSVFVSRGRVAVPVDYVEGDMVLADEKEA